MGNLIMRKGKYSNKDAIDNVLHYITRTRDGDNGKDIYFKYTCGVNSYAGIEKVIEEFKIIGNIHNIDARGGRRIFHEMYTLSPEQCEKLPLEVILEALKYVAIITCNEYFILGFQVVACVHIKDSLFPHPHIHYAINAINYIDGYKWKTCGSDLKIRKEKQNYYYDEYIQKYYYTTMSINDLYM